MPEIPGCSMTDAEKVRLKQLMEDEPIESYVFGTDGVSPCGENRNNV